jgi:hypothetical protein
MEVEPRRVRGFFYGTFMNPVVLAEYGIIAKDVLPARVAGFDLNLRPREMVLYRSPVVRFTDLVSHPLRSQR